MDSRISATTSLYAFIGSPAHHSKSPIMHNLAFKELNIDSVYLAFDIKPEQLEDTIKSFKILKVQGSNVSMPHKEAIIPYLDEISTASRLCNAVNTIKLIDNHYYGTITDGIGFIKAINEQGWDIVNKKITIVGAGGACKAIMVQMALDGASEIIVYNRSKKDEFIKIINNTIKETNCKIEFKLLSDLDSLKQDMHNSYLFINTKTDIEKEKILEKVPNKVKNIAIAIIVLIIFIVVIIIIKLGSDALDRKYLINEPQFNGGSYNGGLVPEESISTDNSKGDTTFEGFDNIFSIGNNTSQKNEEEIVNENTQEKEIVKDENIRNVFLESMCFIPELITNEGKANLNLELSDNITTWTIQTVGNTKDGRIGYGILENVKVFKEFFVDFELPNNLVQSDKISIPVTVYNYTNEVLKTTIKIKFSQLNKTKYQEYMSHFSQNEDVYSYFSLKQQTMLTKKFFVTFPDTSVLSVTKNHRYDEFEVTLEQCGEVST